MEFLLIYRLEKNNTTIDVGTIRADSIESLNVQLEYVRFTENGLGISHVVCKDFKYAEGKPEYRAAICDTCGRHRKEHEV